MIFDPGFKAKKNIWMKAIRDCEKAAKISPSATGKNKFKRKRKKQGRK